MNDHKKAEQAKRDKLVEDYLRDVGATKCPTDTKSKNVVVRKLTAEDRSFRSKHYAGLSKRQLGLADYAPCNDSGIDMTYLTHSEEGDYEDE